MSEVTSSKRRISYDLWLSDSRGGALGPTMQQRPTEDTHWVLALGPLREEVRVPDLGSRLTAEPLDLGPWWVAAEGPGPSLSGAQPQTLKTVVDPQPGAGRAAFLSLASGHQGDRLVSVPGREVRREGER